MSHPKHSPFLLSLSALALTLACGGGSSSKSVDTPRAATPATPVAAKAALPDPFWSSDSPERPHRATPLNAAPSTPNLIQLNEAEMHLLQQGMAAAPAAPSTPRDASLIATPLRIVTGLNSYTYHQETKTTLQPANLTSSTIQALVPNTSGGFDTLTGVGHDDGTFSILNVPVGNYWLRFGTQYLWTSADHVEWVTDTYGRTDAVYPGNPTSLIMNANNLNAWQNTDELLFNVPNQGFYISVPAGTPGVTNPPVVGALSLSNYTYDFTQIGFGLLSATSGDQAYLNQLTTRTAGDTVYRALGRSWNLPALNMVDGTNATANGAFLDLPQTSTLRLNWRRSAWANMTTQVNPNAVATGAEFGLWASPLGLNMGIPGDAFQLLTFDSGALGTSDLDLGDLPYGNPYPSAWNLITESYFTWSLSYLAPGASTPAAVRRSTYTATPTLPSASAPLSPLVSPVLNPKINGKDLFQNQLAVGTNPVISWDLPSTGTPTGYLVRIMELQNNAGATRMLTRGLLRTATRSITVPPGIMNAGTTYVIFISAIRTPGVNFNQYPFQTTFPYASAPCMGAIVAP
jgi:hypothetical protein